MLNCDASGCIVPQPPRQSRTDLESAVMSLGAILDLTGPLTDHVGPNNARERFRRFLSHDLSHASAVWALIQQAQQSTDEQAQRALGDLVVTLGRFIGCEVAYGTYARTPF